MHALGRQSSFETWDAVSGVTPAAEAPGRGQPNPAPGQLRIRVGYPWFGEDRVEHRRGGLSSMAIHGSITRPPHRSKNVDERSRQTRQIMPSLSEHRLRM